MSVINQMLVDLERRRASGAETQRIPDHVRALPGESFSGRRSQVLIAAMVIVAVAVMAGAWWWMNGRVPSASAGKREAVSASVRKAEPAAVPLAPAAVEAVAQRMSLELANIPASVVDTPIAAASVMSPREPAPVVMKQRSAPPVKTPPLRSAKTAAEPQHADIVKKMRVLTPRQRAGGEYANGVTALNEGRMEDARTAFEAALQADPSYHGARQALVGVLLNARNQTEAAQVLQEGLSISPSQSGFAMALARLQVERGELNAGVQTLAHSLEFSTDNADYIAFYAGLLQRQQKHAEAIEQFSRALAQRGNVGVWLLGLGISLDAQGRSGDAQEAYRRAKASGNLSPELRVFADQRLR